jgi:AcrR family transcriptional regulator
MSAETERRRPKAYHHGDLRNALIQAGLELLAEGGAAALDLRKVARKAGVSHAAPYRHFADKQALIAAIDEVGFQQLAEQIERGLSGGASSAFEQLEQIAGAYVRFAQEHPWLMREMYSGLSLDRTALPSLYAASKRVFLHYVDVIRQGQASGRIVDGDPNALAGVLWSMLHGVALLIIEGQFRPYNDGPHGTEGIVHLCMQTLYDGLGRKP